ncbi:MAG: TIGR00296 family protein [Candidatus Norongarragalinales archaeon]
MDKLLSLEQGRELVRAARRAIEEKIDGRETAFEPKLEKRGVFVTLETFPQRDLRGCIGFPEPVRELDAAVREAALAAAFGDPRFPPISRGELDKIVVEISVLTQPKPLEARNADEIPRKIKIGRDGLILRRGWNSGLLLPIVPVELGWNANEFLEHLCDKAGLERGSWHDKNAKLFVFQSQVFREREPRGVVEEVDLLKEAVKHGEAKNKKKAE